MHTDPNIEKSRISKLLLTCFNVTSADQIPLAARETPDYSRYRNGLYELSQLMNDGDMSGPEIDEIMAQLLRSAVGVIVAGQQYRWQQYIVNGDAVLTALSKDPKITTIPANVRKDLEPLIRSFPSRLNNAWMGAHVTFYNVSYVRYLFLLHVLEFWPEYGSYEAQTKFRSVLTKYERELPRVQQMSSHDQHAVMPNHVKLWAYSVQRYMSGTLTIAELLLIQPGVLLLEFSI